MSEPIDLQTVRFEPVSAGVGALTIDQPKTINALSEQVMDDMMTVLQHVAGDRDIKALILRTAGPHFCSGHNLKEMTARRQDPDQGDAYFHALFAQCSQLMQAIVRLPQPVIAEVTGIATAAGCQLVASCDLAIAADDARFSTPGVNIGLFCSTPMVALSRNVSRKHAMEMLLTGEFIDAQRALDFGLINRVVPTTELQAEVEDLAALIASKSPKALKVGKEAFYNQLEMPLDKAYAYAGRVMAENMMARDAADGIGAVLNKDPMPEWKGD